LRLKCIEHYNSTTKNKPDYICKIAPSQEINHDTIVTNKKNLGVCTQLKKCSNQNQADPKAGSFVFFKEKESSKKHQCFFTAAPTQHIFFLLKIFKKKIIPLNLLHLKIHAKFF